MIWLKPLEYALFYLLFALNIKDLHFWAKFFIYNLTVTVQYYLIAAAVYIFRGMHTKHISKKLHASQNKILRIIAGVSRRTSLNFLYDELNILKVKKLYMHGAGFCMYKYENDMLSDVFKDTFVKVTNVHDHKTHIATTNQLYISIYRAVCGQKSFKYVGVKTWSYIPQKVNTALYVALNH